MRITAPTRPRKAVGMPPGELRADVVVMALQALITRGCGSVTGGACSFGEGGEAHGGLGHLVAMGAVGQLRLDEVGAVGEFGERFVGRVASGRLPVDREILGRCAIFDGVTLDAIADGGGLGEAAAKVDGGGRLFGVGFQGEVDPSFEQ